MMTRDAAEKVVELLVSAAESLNEALSLVRGRASESEFKHHCKQTGEAMAIIYLDLIKPIVKFYPDLDPGREGATSNGG